MEARKALADRAVCDIAGQIRTSKSDGPGKTREPVIDMLNAMIAFRKAWVFVVRKYKKKGDSPENRKALIQYLTKRHVSEENATSLILELANHDKCSHAPRETQAA